MEQGTFTPLVITSTGGMADGDDYNHILDKGEGILCHSTISLAVSQRNQEKEKSSQYI